MHVLKRAPRPRCGRSRPVTARTLRSPGVAEGSEAPWFDKLHEIGGGTQPQVFVSYARHDAEQVLAIARLLEEEGATVWRDR